MADAIIIMFDFPYSSFDYVDCTIVFPGKML